MWRELRQGDLISTTKYLKKGVTLEEEGWFFVGMDSKIRTRAWKIHRRWIWVQLKKECSNRKELPLGVVGQPLRVLGYPSDGILRIGQEIGLEMRHAWTLPDIRSYSLGNPRGSH